MSKVKNYAEIAQNFQSVETAGQILDKGKHKVRLVNAVVLHSGITKNGEPKENYDNDYSDVTTQLYVELGSTSDEGAIAHRFNLEGFLKYESLTPSEKESGKFQPSEGPTAYALKKDRSGNLVRVHDEENTMAAHRILSQAFKAMGLPAGSTIDDLEDVIEDRREFIADVGVETWDGKERSVLKNLLPAMKEAPVTESFD